MSTYSKDEIIKKLEVAKSEMWKFYSQDFVNYRGKTSDNEKTLRILELKKPDSKETMLRCVLEAYTYLKIVDKAKLLKDFSLPEDTKIKACPFVFYGKERYREIQEDRKHLKDLIEKLGVEVIYLEEKDGEYSVVK